jgi:tetratricopeptide (TPR) repeat protein
MGAAPRYFAPMPNVRPWQGAAFVAAVALAVQCAGLRDVFLWDDVLLLRDTNAYTDSAQWVESVTSPLGGATYYWRPAATTSFLVDSWLHGASAWGFRLTSALLHAAASTIAFTLFLRLLGGPRTALLAALAFAVHPVNVETVTWISARFDLMAGLFGLAALAAMPPLPDARGRWRLVALFALLACLSKESAYLLPLVAVAWAQAARLRWRAAALWTGVGLAAALFLRYEALGYWVRLREASVVEGGGALQRVLLVGRAVATSAQALLLPWGTVGPAHHATRPIQPDDVLGWAGVAIALALVAAIVVAWRRRRRLAWLLIAMVVSFAPASQVMPLDLAGGLHAADRYLYLPSFFAIAALADLAAAFVASRPGVSRAAGGVAAGLVVALAAWRVALLPRWNDTIRFWTWAAEMAPECGLIHANLAGAHVVAGHLEDAEREARLGGPIAAGILAESLARQGRLEAARSSLDAALAQRPDDAQLRVQRGEIELALRQTADALADFEAAIRARDAADRPRPDVVLARALAGSAEVLAGTPGGLGHARDRAARAEDAAGPRDAIAWLRVASAWIAVKDAARASAAIDRAAAAGANAGDVDSLREARRRLTEGD